MRAFRRGLVTFAVTVAVASVVVPAAAAQDVPALPAKLQPATRAAVTALGDSMAAEGLPARAIYDRAAEGALKGADDARILVAVRRLAQRLREARATLGAAATEAELLAAVSASSQGVTSDVVKRVATKLDGRTGGPSLALALAVLADLVAHRVPMEAAVASVEALVSSGARDIDLTEFQRYVEQDIRAGRAPRDATQERTQGAIRIIERRKPE